jgi:hypothetical protein
MTQTEIKSSIETVLCGLNNINEQLFDYWMCQLFDENDTMIKDEWNEETLKMMEDDVMSLTIFDGDDDTL